MNPYQQGQPGTPYPPYPQSNQPYAHNIGFSGAPQSFGMPYGGMQQPSPYPQGYPSHPQQGQGQYPTQQSQYPTQQSQYPSQQQQYPTQQQQYPGQQSNYPQQPQYPSQPSSYPSQQSPYPAQQSQYPTQQSQYPSQGSQYPIQQSQYPQQYGQASQAAPAPNKPRPTVVPHEPFNPRADAEALRKAMKGFGTDEKAIIQILTKRSNQQRLQIAYEFKTLYGKDLHEDLESECTGKFEDVVLALMTPLPQFYAKELKNALSGVGTDEDVLIEVLCTMSNHEIRIIQDAYQSMYNSALSSDLASDTSGSFHRLMNALSCANRDESFNVDMAQAKADAQSLLRAGELRMGTDESTFNAILCQRSFTQLAATFGEYEMMTGHEFEKAIKNEFSGDIQDGLLAIVKCVRNRADFFAERLHMSMAGLGTTDSQLIRIMVTRSEVDLGDIKDAFEAKYGKSLQSWIEGDCSGHYKKCLLGLIGCY